jgi:nitroreductase
MSSFINRVKNKINALLFWQTSIGEYLNKWYDLKLFFKYSFKNNTIQSKQNLIASLTKDYHIVEKGLALPYTRNEFGKNKVIEIIKKASNYVEKFGQDNLIEDVKSCLRAYYDFNKNNNVNVESDYFIMIKDFATNNINNGNGGTKTVTKSSIIEATNLDFETFVKTRASIRDFDSSELDIITLQKAISLARFTPSVCNRQAWKAHLYTDSEKVLQVLQFQNGHSGFKESIKGVFVITADVSMFTRLETNQIFIDGGLFAMSVMYALHFYNIGSCPLNTCIPYIDEIELKKTVGINPSERVIMMIGIGNLKQEYKVAISNRRDVEHFFIHHN